MIIKCPECETLLNLEDEDFSSNDFYSVFCKTCNHTVKIKKHLHEPPSTLAAGGQANPEAAPTADRLTPADADSSALPTTPKPYEIKRPPLPTAIKVYIGLIIVSILGLSLVFQVILKVVSLAADEFIDLGDLLWEGVPFIIVIPAFLVFSVAYLVWSIVVLIRLAGRSKKAVSSFRLLAWVDFLIILGVGFYLSFDAFRLNSLMISTYFMNISLMLRITQWVVFLMVGMRSFWLFYSYRKKLDSELRGADIVIYKERLGGYLY